MVRAEHLRRTRLAIFVAVTVLHLIAIGVLVRAFAPRIGAAVLRPVTAAFDVPVSRPSPEPPPERRERPAAADAEGAAAPARKKAVQPAAPAPRIAVAPATVPASSAGSADVDRGAGAGGAGAGTGAGASGTGTGGGGGGTKAVKIAGDIISARDYPRASRGLRLGSAVTVALTVGIDGRVSECRVVRPSRDHEADAITCRLASERFRFRPARDGSGRAIVSIYGWQQRWFTPGAE